MDPFPWKILKPAELGWAFLLMTFPKKNLGEEIRKSDNHEISPGEPAKQIEKTWNPIPWYWLLNRDPQIMADDINPIKKKSPIINPLHNPNHSITVVVWLLKVSVNDSDMIFVHLHGTDHTGDIGPSTEVETWARSGSCRTFSGKKQ